MTSLRFHDRMSGFVSRQERDYNEAWLDGRRARRRLAFDVEIEIDDVDRHLRDPAHTARLQGRIECEELGGVLPVADGVFNLYVAEGECAARMRYRLFARTATATT